MKTDNNLKKKLEDYKRKMMRGMQISPKKMDRRRRSKPEDKAYSPEKTGNVHLRKKILNEMLVGGKSKDILPNKKYDMREKQKPARKGTLLNSCQNADVENSLIKTNSYVFNSVITPD